MTLTSTTPQARLMAMVMTFLLTGPALAQTSRPRQPRSADPEKVPASPRSSVDMSRRSIGPTHNRPIEERDGRTYLWAGVDEHGETLWFDMTDALVDPASFQFGIGKDRIQSIDDPLFTTPDDPQLARYGIGDETDVFGFEHNGVVKAYPIFILDRVEVVNDNFDGVPFAVCW